MLGIVGLVTPAQGGGVPVYDATAHVARLEQLLRAAEQLTAAKAMLDTSRTQLQALTGTRGYGTVLSPALVSTMPDGARSMAALLAGESGGSVAFDLVDQLRLQSPLEVSVEAYGSGAGGEYHNSLTRLGQGAEAIGRVAYAELARDLSAVNALTNLIDHADDPKAAIDLQSRLLAQNAKSLLITGKILAAAEIARAKRQNSDAARALEFQRMVAPRFVNPRLSN